MDTHVKLDIALNLDFNEMFDKEKDFYQIQSSEFKSPNPKPIPALAPCVTVIH